MTKESETSSLKVIMPQIDLSAEISLLKLYQVTVSCMLCQCCFLFLHDYFQCMHFDLFGLIFGLRMHKCVRKC